jgi:hypothetical membrane protein
VNQLTQASDRAGMQGLECVGSVVVAAFQITFHVKMHVNDVFSFFKNHF